MGQPEVDVPPGAKGETEVREGKSGRTSKGRKQDRSMEPKKVPHSSF